MDSYQCLPQCRTLSAAEEEGWGGGGADTAIMRLATICLHHLPEAVTIHLKFKWHMPTVMFMCVCMCVCVCKRCIKSVLHAYCATYTLHTFVEMTIPSHIFVSSSLIFFAEYVSFHSLMFMYTCMRVYVCVCVCAG